MHWAWDFPAWGKRQTPKSSTAKPWSSGAPWAIVAASPAVCAISRSIISAITRAILYSIAGLLLHMTILVGGLALAPFVFIGLKIGHRIHVGLTQEQMRRVVGAIVVVTGTLLLFKG